MSHEVNSDPSKLLFERDRTGHLPSYFKAKKYEVADFIPMAASGDDVVDQPAMSQLSVDAACFVPTNFGQSVASTSDEVPSYFDSYVWQGTEIKDSSPYLGSLGQWPLGLPYGSPGMQPPFHYGQYPPVDYWPMTLGNENLTSRISPGGRPADTFNSPYTDISWNSLPLQEPNVSNGVSVRRPKSNRVKEPSHTHPRPINSAAASKGQVTSPSAVPSESGEPVRTKKKKKKSRSIIRLETNGVGGLTSAAAGTDVQSKDGERGKIVEEEDGNTRGNTSLIPGDVPSPQAGSKVYKDNDAQTDFSEELSRLTLSEKPSSLYDLSVSPDFFKSYSFTENSTTATLNSTGTAPSKPLLWATIVSQTAAHPAGKTNVPFDPKCKSKSDQFTRSGTDSVNKKNEKKLGFDHSSVRSQSGKRKSTGISTSDQKRDHSSSSKAKHEYSSGKHEYSPVKHEYSSGKHEYSVGKQKESSEKLLTMASERNFKGETSLLTKPKREVLVDGKRIQGATEGSSKSQRVFKNINNDFPAGEGRNKKQLPRENGADFFSIKREEGNQTPSARQYEERNLRNGVSRSPSWRRSQTIGSSSSRSKTAETCELSRSVSGGRVVTGGVSSVKNKAGAEKDKWQQAKSRKTSLLQDNGSKWGETTSAVKPEVKAEGSAKRRRKNRKKKTGAKEDREVEEKDPAAENNNSSLSVGPSILMQFDDDDEFPGLLYAAQVSLNEVSSGPIKYSDILSGRAKTPSRIYTSDRPKMATKENKPDISVEEDESSDWDLDTSTSKQKESLQKTPQKTISARSISQPPKSTPKPMQEKRAVGAGAKTKEPITLSLFDMITVKSKNKKTPEKEDDKKPLKTGTKSSKDSKSGNVLDSSGVHMRRGKEREVPKPKKPSLLRKVILKERESRRQKFLRDCMGNNAEEDASPSDLTEDICDDELRRHASAPMRTSVPRVASVSPSAAKDVPSPQANLPASEAKDPHKEMLQSMIHSRRFREYCTQVLSKEIDDCCMLLLQELVRFQDRLYHKDPNKARLKRRIVLGLREVTKHLKARRIKCVIISPNLERIQSKGGLDEALHNIIEMCQGQNIPFMFALSRKQLGKACCKVVPVSVVGIFSYEGAEEHFKKLKDLTEKARESYTEMVSNLAAELEELCQLYPEESWPVNENICDEYASENMSNPSSCMGYGNVNISVGNTSDITCSLSSCKTLGDAQGQFCHVDLANLARQPTQDNEDSYNPPDSAHESRVTDGLIMETGSETSLETGQVREHGGQAQET